MVLWPVRAALGAGAGRVVVVDSPAERCGGAPGRRRAGGPAAANGTGGAVAAAIEHLDAEPATGDEAPVLVLSGDVPLSAPRRSAALAEAHEASGAAATMATSVLDDPSGYGRVVRDAAGAVIAVVETKASGDATPAQREINEVNAGIFAFDADALRAALPRLSADNAQGELYLPQVLDLLRADGAHGRRARARGPAARCSASTTARPWRSVRALAQPAIHERHMLAGVDIVDPRGDGDRRRRADRPGHVIEPFTTIRGRTRIGARLHGQALLPRRLPAGGRRERRSVRLPAPRRDAARGRQGGHVRGGQELRHRRRRRKSRTCPTSATRTWARARTSGAATITANYDGRAKHRTTIGKRVRTAASTRRSSRR